MLTQHLNRLLAVPGLDVGLAGGPAGNRHGALLRLVECLHGFGCRHHAEGRRYLIKRRLAVGLHVSHRASCPQILPWYYSTYSIVNISASIFRQSLTKNSVDN